MSDWIQLTTADDPIEAGFLRGLLESSGFEVQVRSMELWTAAVEIYYSEGARPSIWVRQRDLEGAREALARRDHSENEPPWTCGRCGERLEAQFTTCWQCGESRSAIE